MADAWDEKSVFLEALSLSPAARDAYLEQACPNQAARDRIDRVGIPGDY